MLENKESIDKLEALNTVVDWYRESRTENDLTISMISNKIANKIIDYVIEPILEPVLDDIRLQIKDNGVSVQFNSKPFKSELKPYVEFVKKINDAEVAAMKIKFQITSEVRLHDVEIKYVHKNTTINLGRLEGIMEVSITGLNTPIAQFAQPISLGKREFSVALPTISGKYLKETKKN